MMRKTCISVERMMFAVEAKKVWSEVAIIVEQVESISVAVINSLTPQSY